MAAEAGMSGMLLLRFTCLILQHEPGHEAVGMARDKVGTHRFLRGRLETGTRSLPPHLVGQSRNQGLLRIKGWENRLYLFSERNFKASWQKERR